MSKGKGGHIKVLVTLYRNGYFAEDECGQCRNRIQLRVRARCCLFTTRRGYLRVLRGGKRCKACLAAEAQARVLSEAIRKSPRMKGDVWCPKFDYSGHTVRPERKGK